MKKCMVLFLVCCLLFACCQQIRAEEELEYVYVGVNNKSYIQFRSVPLTNVFEVPETLGGVPVTGVDFGKLNLEKHDVIETLVIPKTITSIRLDDSLGLFGLKEIQVDEENPAYCSVDGILYNKDCTVLLWCPQRKTGKLEMPQTVTKVETRLSNLLTQVVYSDAVTYIGQIQFSTFPSLTSLQLPKKLKSVQDYAFMDCRKLKMVVIPKTVEYIGREAFGHKSELVSDDCIGPVPMEGFTVYGYTRVAQEYAKKYGFTFYDLNVLEDTQNPLESGDLSANRQVDAKDALLVLKCAVGKIDLHSIQLKLGDVNNDTTLNAKDALEILKFAVGKPSVLQG